MERCNEQLEAESMVSPPLIAKLHRDLLWRIFALNADIETRPGGVYHTDELFRLSPLTTARHTSQVCAFWRELIIGSPSLWGNMIDLNSLRQRSDTWRNEVLLRTGNSELSISGNISDGAQGVTEFFALVLKHHWPRIMRVHVGIHNFGAQNWPEGTWSALERPAPSLRSFSIIFQGGLPHVCSSPGFSLFANHAHLLTRFQQNHIPIKLKASWIASLTSLTLNSAPTLRILLDACSRIHSLETLRLMFGITGPPPEDRLQSMNIPSLTTLHIACPFDVALSFLDHIKPAPGCTLRLLSSLKNTSTTLVLAQRIISRFTNNYFSHHRSTSYYLKFIPHAMNMGDVSAETFYDEPWYKGFVVSIYGRPSIPAAFLALCSAPLHLSHVEILRLHIQQVRPANTSESTFPDFLIAMTALEKLQITTGGLDLFIISLAKFTEKRIFPHLKTLIWAPDSGYSRDLSDGTKLIQDFLAMRQNIGIPIEILDFTKWNALSQVPMDITKLEEFIGLKVIWQERSGVRMNQREYVCGSGGLQE